MKPSKYNITVTTSKGSLCYNTLTDASIYLPQKKYNTIFGKPTIDEQELEIESEERDKIIENRFLVPDDTDEYLELCNEYESEVIKSRVFDLTLLPTLDCNLRCWYCFESHIKGSRMNSEVQNNIFNFIRKTFQGNPELEHLSVEMFGGEPLLYFEEEVYPLLMRIKTYLDEINKSVSFFFVTNAVCIKEKHIPLFENLHANFQISIDGYKEKHDKVKFVPKTHMGTYDKVINTIKKLTSQIDSIYINLRINYDDETLLHIDEIVNDLVDVDRNKIGIHLERIWQTFDKSEFPNPMLNGIINMLILNNFNVSYMNLHRRSFSCKSSKNNQAIISYDGHVYKCSGRNFDETLKEGQLNYNGNIVWDENKISKRLRIKTFDNVYCRNCKFLPQCWGPCSQKLLESDDIERFCQLKHMELTIPQYIIYRFNNNYMREQRMNKYKNIELKQGT